MQYNILINQKAVIDNRLSEKLDLFDLALFDYIYHFFNSNSNKKMTFNANGKEYVEIRLSLINENMPLLAMKSRSTFISRMKKLVDAKLLERYENNSIENKSGYRQGENFSIFVFEKEKEGDKMNEQPVQEIVQGCTRSCAGGVREVEHNHNTKEYKTNKHKEYINNSSETTFVDTMYALYPAKCPLRNASLGKCHKDKDRIRKLLKIYTKEQIETVFNYEIDTKYGKAWMSNFATFLNNFPDPYCLNIESSNSDKNEESTKEGHFIKNGIVYR